MSKKSLVLYFSVATLVIGWMIWHDFHLPNCLALYGVHSKHDSVDMFLSCEDLHTAEVFRVQLIALGCIFGAAILVVLYEVLWSEI